MRLHPFETNLILGNEMDGFSTLGMELSLVMEMDMSWLMLWESGTFLEPQILYFCDGMVSSGITNPGALISSVPCRVKIC